MEPSELKNYAIEHIERDLKINRDLNGVDFSQFLSEYVTICTGHQYLRPLERDSLRESILFRMMATQEGLRELLGKPVHLHESSKAGLAITQISELDELDKLDQYASELAANIKSEDYEINNSASRCFTSGV
jgi:hypothetical protein